MSKTRILVVDDELSIIKLLRANLEAEGYEGIREALQPIATEA